MYYTSNKIDTYNRLFNFVVGLRGVGKTYHFTEKVLRKGIEVKKPVFVWVRRMIKDIDAIKHSWMNDVEHLFPDWMITTQNNAVFITHRKTKQKYCVGYFIALSDYIRAKSRPYPYVQYVVFDEFLLEDGKYLTNEVNNFLNLVHSIIRLRENCKVYLLGNASSMINPYFDFFKVSGNNLINNFVKGENFVIENCDYQEYRNAVINSKLGGVINGTNYGKYAIDNKFLLDDITDVKPIPSGKKEMVYNLRLNGLLIAVYYVNGLLYFGKGRDETYTTYTFYPQDAKTYGCQLLSNKSPQLKVLVKDFLNGCCLYETLRIKNEIQLIVRLVYKNW